MTKELPKILYVSSLNVGTGYWRIENYANEMVRQKVPVFVEYLFDPRTRYAWDMLCVGADKESERIQNRIESAFQFYDIIIFQKIQNLNGLALVSYFKRKYPNVLVGAEIDDSLGEMQRSNHHRIKNEFYFAAEHVALSDFVITTNTYLAKSMIPLNKNIIIAPNCIDKATWGDDNCEGTTEKKFVYVAAAGHDEDIELIVTVMNKIHDKHPDVMFSIRYGGYIPECLKRDESSWIDFEQVAWPIDQYPNELRKLNPKFALAPLRDSEFNRCKSNLKVIEWASMGVPVIASDVEPYQKTLGPVILAQNTVSSWYSKIESAILDEFSINRDRIKSKIDENYNLSSHCARVVKELSKLWYKRLSSLQKNLGDDNREANGQYFINTAGPTRKSD